MTLRTDLPDISKYTFGAMSLGRKETNLKQDIQTARAAMASGVWFHASREYAKGDTFMVLRMAYDEARSEVPRCILKIRCDLAETIRFDVEDAVRRLGIDRVDIAQLCDSNFERRAVVDDFLAQGPMFDTCCRLREEGLVGNFVMEVFASFSQDAIRAVENDLFDGYIFYFNAVERQMSNPLFDLVQEKVPKLLALRTVGSGMMAKPVDQLPNDRRIQESQPRLQEMEEIFMGTNVQEQRDFLKKFIQKIIVKDEGIEIVYYAPGTKFPSSTPPSA